MEKARQTLKANPKDPQANLTVGKFVALYEGDWATGLPKLAGGGDEPLAMLAADDLKGASDAGGQVDLGDRWWNLAQKEEEGVTKAQLLARAAHWYQLALPTVPAGLARAKVQKRLADIAQTLQAIPVQRTAIQPPATAIGGPPGAQVSPGPMAPAGRTAYLDDVPLLQYSEGSKLGRHGRVWDNRRLARFRGSVPRHTLGMTGPERKTAFATFDLQGKFRTFTAIAAQPDVGERENPRSGKIFMVFGDDRLLWRSRPIMHPNDGQPCTVNVTGVRILKLAVDRRDSEYGEPTWINPQVSQ